MSTRTENEKARIRKVQELRRSNAATPVPSKKTYTRKRKHKKKWKQNTIVNHVQKILHKIQFGIFMIWMVIQFVKNVMTN